MLNVIDDGIWYQKCRKFHPTLMWHEKYGYEKTKDGITSELKRQAQIRPGMFGFIDKNNEEKEKIFDELVKINLESRLIADAKPGECIVCGWSTSFISKMTGRHVCSDECLYKENGWDEEATGESVGL